MVTRVFTVIIANRRLRRRATGRDAGKASLLDGIFGGNMVDPQLQNDPLAF